MVTFDFGNAEWYNVGHVSVASDFTATVVSVAHFVAPNVSTRTFASGVFSNNPAL